MTHKTNGSKITVKTEPNSLITFEASDSSNQTINATSNIAPAHWKPPLTKAVIEDLNRIWDANPSVPSLASRIAWAEARGLHRTRVHDWFTGKRRREKASGRPHAGGYELPIDAPGVPKQEIRERLIPQVSYGIDHMAGIQCRGQSSGPETFIHPKLEETMPTSCQRPPSRSQSISSMTLTSCDDYNIGSKRQLDTRIISANGSSIKARKRQKVDLLSKPTDSSSQPSQLTSKSNPTVASKDTEVGNTTSTTLPTSSTVESKGLQAPATADASSRIANPAFHGGRSMQGVTSASTSNGGTEARNKPLSEDACFGANVWLQT